MLLLCVCVCFFLIFLPDCWSQSDSLYNLIAVSWKMRNKNTTNLEYSLVKFSGLHTCVCCMGVHCSRGKQITD